MLVVVNVVDVTSRLFSRSEKRRAKLAPYRTGVFLKKRAYLQE